MEPGSSIVATASLAGLMAMPLDPIYTLTKHAVVGFVRAVAPQLAERGDHDQRALPGLRRHADRRRRAARVGRRTGLIPLIAAETVAEAALAAARSGRDRPGVGRPAGREPLVYEFRGVPGPR